MALAALLHKHGPGNEIHHQLLLILQQKSLYMLYITNKMECFSFKGGCVACVAKQLKKTDS